MDKKIFSQLTRLESWFKEKRGVIVAFSGGVDSALVAFLSRKFLGKEKTIAVISKSESLKSRDFQIARDFARKQDVYLKVVHTNELQDSRYVINSPQRCYFCKTNLYSTLWLVQKEYPHFVIANGTNKDDFSDFRPGHKAAGEFKIYSPLAECGLTKQDIRNMARHFGLEIWDKPASPCLSSRIPYDIPITSEKLKQIEKAEEILFNYGYKNVRVRWRNNGSCSIEVPADEIEKLKLQAKFILPEIKTTAGFSSCVIDEEGFVSGKLNRVLTN